MCGIVGYIGRKREELQDIILDGLRKLEYRGYDSWGIALVSNPSVAVKKYVGAISEATLRFDDGVNAHAAIGHTRWATHGGVCEANAHPHLDCTGNIAIVHNGIIENYAELRRRLERKGHEFSSDTDSEVVAHLIEENMKAGMSFGMAFREAIRELKGSYAIIAAHGGSKALLCARKDSPLVIGMADHGHFICSDPVAFLEHTKKAIFLDDHEMGVVTENGVWIIDLERDVLKKKNPIIIEWDVSRAEKQGYPHFMEKEIMEQEDTILKAVMQPEKVIEKAARMLNEAYGVFFVACGSSYYAALASSYIFSKVAKKHINVVDASEFKYYEHFITPKTLVVAISQSGETADVLDAVKTAKKKKARIMAITNVMGSTLMRMADFTILMNCGPEICVVATKSFTAQLAILETLAYATVQKAKEVRKAYEDLVPHIRDVLSPGNRNFLDGLAERMVEKHHIFCIGRGISHAMALEAALKIKEVTYIHAEGFAGGALKHGNIALIEKGTPCIVFAPEDETHDEIVSNAMEVKSRGGWIIGIGSRRHEVFDEFIKVPHTEIGNAILSILPVQYLAYRIAVLRGYDPDKPRNLAKSVTVK